MRRPAAGLVYEAVETSGFTPEQRATFARLLDDTSPAVRQSLLAHFMKHGHHSVEFLRQLASQSDRTLAAHAGWFLRELDYSDPVTEFRGFIRSLNYELETGALLLSRTINPDIDIGACCARLDSMAARCRELIAEPASVREKCRVISRVLFHEYGLRGNTDHYADPLNSYLDQVLIRRKGIPISLSIVYLLVAERLGLSLEPVGLPGHFVVGCYAEQLPFYIDPFNSGSFINAGEAVDLLRRQSTHPTIADLAPTPVREVLCRCCRNLVNHYSVANDPDRARLFAEFVAEFEATYERHTT
ncbi:transglutaminase-like domain-containing protein [Oleiharenicola lentus]|nr:transglutaminase-like domain-containing protein [Oleiharenicola lentus]